MYDFGNPCKCTKLVFKMLQTFGFYPSVLDHSRRNVWRMHSGEWPLCWIWDAKSWPQGSLLTIGLSSYILKYSVWLRGAIHKPKVNAVKTGEVRRKKSHHLWAYVTCLPLVTHTCGTVVPTARLWRWCPWHQLPFRGAWLWELILTASLQLRGKGAWRQESALCHQQLEQVATDAISSSEKSIWASWCQITSLATSVPCFRKLSFPCKSTSI